MKKIFIAIVVLAVLGIGYVAFKGKNRGKSPPTPLFQRGVSVSNEEKVFPPLSAAGRISPLAENRGGQGGFDGLPVQGDPPSEEAPHPPDEALIPALPMTGEEERRMDENELEGYPRDLVRRTRRYLETWKISSDKEVLAFLDKLNSQIHEANREMLDHYDLFKKYHEEGNFKAMEDLQQQIFDKHVALFPNLAPDKGEPPMTPEEKEFSKKQFLLLLDIMRQTGLSF
ncbi:MAG: hypothetical protein Q7T11_06915 [Deltaproteobacteria bacterium]|nr:hypothetical protein [Deltaproteobacteria bacterium]